MNQFPQRSYPPVPGLLPTSKDLRPERDPVGWRCTQFTKTPGFDSRPTPRQNMKKQKNWDPSLLSLKIHVFRRSHFLLDIQNKEESIKDGEGLEGERAGLRNGGGEVWGGVKGEARYGNK